MSSSASSEPLIQHAVLAGKRRRTRFLCDLLYQGPVIYRIVAGLVGAISAVTSAIEFEKRVLHHSLDANGIVLSLYGVPFGLFVFFLESISSYSSDLKGNIICSVKFLKYIWGRGIIYLFFGSLQIINATTADYVGGGSLMSIGCIGILIGSIAAAMLKSELKNIPYSELKELWRSSRDGDGGDKLTLEDFVRFWEIANLDDFGSDLHLFFIEAATKHGGKISFDDFYKWLTRCETLKSIDNSSDNSEGTRQVSFDDQNSSSSETEKASNNLQATVGRITPFSWKKRRSHRSGFNSRYEIGEELGRGHIFTVNKGTNVRTGKKYAIKSAVKSTLSFDDAFYMKNEALQLSELDHKHVLRLHEYFDEDEAMYVVSDLMSGDTLYDKIVQNSFYPEEDARVAFASLLDALQYIHSKGVVHRDVKPERLLLRDPQSRVDIVLGGFSYSEKVNEHSNLTEHVGTPSYIAPEMLKGEAYGLKVDLWSAGVTLFILLCGKRPFTGCDQEDLFQKIRAGAYNFDEEQWQNVSEEAKDLVASLLTVDPKIRLSATEAMRHSWFGHDIEEGR